jgi:hypothetical protein
MATKKVQQLPEVKIKGKGYKKADPQSSLKSHGQVATRRIDSIRKANPAMGRAIGKPYKGSGGMDTYGDDASDKIRASLKGGKKK